MSEILVTASGVVGTEPRHLVIDDVTPVTSFRLASTRRRLVKDQWVDGPTTWVTVTCWRQLACTAVAPVQGATQSRVAGLWLALHQRNRARRQVRLDARPHLRHA